MLRIPFPAAAVFAALLSACPAAGDDDSAGPPPPACVPALATDIDETLTTSDSEFFQQILDATHDPEMRPEANLLMQDYAALGYTVIYVTARGTDTTLDDGTGAYEATDAWLDLHGFPRSDGDLFLHEGSVVMGDDAVDYKTGVIEGKQALDHRFDWAYGNAETDILAFQAAGIPDERIFLVGELAGGMGVNPVPDEDAYAAHRASQMPGVVEAACE